MWAQHDSVDWLVLFASIAVMIMFEFFVIRPWFTTTTKTGFSRTGPVVLCWVFAGIVFNLYIGMRHDYIDAIKWMNGYLLEWMLSMDNIFVFHLVFKLYKTPAVLHSKALFWGVLGAILFRMLFFVALNKLLEVMHLCRYAFGLFLVFSGFQAINDDDDDLAGSWPVRFLSWLLRDRLLPAPHYDMEGRLWIVTENPTGGESIIRVSMLLPVIICLELTDVLFAVDSVSAKVGQIPDQFVAYSSSVFAMFGLRSLFFVMEDLVNKLRFLKYGLCFILVFIGLELLLADFIELPATAVCIVLVVIFAVCGILSVLFPEPEDGKGDDEPEMTPACY
jgi:tellurite resistance protein TerC